MRQFSVRWFRDPAQIEHRLWINNASDVDLQKRQNDLEMIQRLSVLSTESLLELWRVKDAVKQRYREGHYWRMRCPVCGGWASYGRSSAMPGMLGVIPKCRDCGWPREICGSNLIIPNPRTGFKFSGFTYADEEHR